MISEIKNEINKGEENIKKQLNGNNKFEIYTKYGLINKSWFKKNKNYLINGKIKEITYKEILPNIDDRDYSYIGLGNNFSFPCNFVFVTEKFMNLLSHKAKVKDKEKIKNFLFEITIGGQCILMKDFHKTPKYRYIILYKENKEDFGNNIDYILIIKDNQQQKKAVDFILNNGLWKYLNKINFTINDEYKSITNSKREVIGKITRNGELNRINELKILELENCPLNNPHSNVNKTKQYLDNNNIFKGNKNSTVIMGNNKHIIFSKPQINLVMFCFYYIKDFTEQLRTYSSNNLIKIILENYEYFKQGKN